MKQYYVVAAVITRENERGEIEVFCAQRPGPKSGCSLDETCYKWEFPGGKIEAGETPSQALQREIREELNACIEVGNCIITVQHQYQECSITLDAFFCTLLSKHITLKEHIDAHWISPQNLQSLSWAAADIPVAAKVARLLAQR